MIDLSTVLSNYADSCSRSPENLEQLRKDIETWHNNSTTLLKREIFNAESLVEIKNDEYDKLEKAVTVFLDKITTCPNVSFHHAHAKGIFDAINNLADIVNEDK